MEFDPVVAARTAADLDALADRMEAGLRADTPALSVAAPGTDEVSRRAAATMTEVGTSFDASSALGVRELRKLAATLRAQGRGLTRMDADNAADLATSV
ncbi:PE family protein [Nocardia vermiculata]|uniref:PE family protein n=1 Tax=Nocardia vermiculata TaxID=257274 RepID=A0A846XXG6_9NOCA|nr:PE domain-containing protein [Nocardia vermiculata]NKY50394.1 PE family protein [Nocardia vermiculata]